jgi:hypothetical protein
MANGVASGAIHIAMLKAFRYELRTSADCWNVRLHITQDISLVDTALPFSDSDITKSLKPIAPHAITISPTGHVLLTLNTSSEVGVGGRDLVVWGKNYESELGNGKRSSISIPTTLETPEGGRFMLKTRMAKEVRDLGGKVWGRNVRVEQYAVVGFGSSAVYWKISKK